MRNRQLFSRLGFGLIFVLSFGLGLACGGPLDTGTAKKPTKNKPAADGTCPAPQIACGTGAFAWCADLQTDAGHCGSCDRACSPGILCQAGTCQQTVCTGSTSPFSGTPDTSDPGPGVISLYRQIFADVNGDRRLDLVEWAFVDGQPMDTFRVSLGQASGGFGAADTYQAGFQIVGIRATNDNDDGADDLIVFAGRSVPYDQPVQVEVWLGHADGHLTFARGGDLRGANTNSESSIAIGDVSGDGWADVVTTTSTDAQRNINVYLSDSTGALHATQTYLTGLEVVYAIFIRDWNVDGRPDLVVLNSAGGSGLEIFYNRGAGTFEQPVNCAVSLPSSWLVSSTSWSSVAVAEDFNHDGLTDFAFGANPIQVVLRQSECGFAPISSYDVPMPVAVPQSIGDNVAHGRVPLVKAADMNGDGQLDLVATFNLNYFADYVPGRPPSAPVFGDTFLSVLLGKPDGTFQLQDTVVSLGPGTITDLAIGEANGDQRPDVVASSADGQTRVWENTCQ